jgi:uncharacterized repeat protein (TIGR01451 family)
MIEFKHVSKVCAGIILSGLLIGCGSPAGEVAPDNSAPQPVAPAPAQAAPAPMGPGYSWLALPTGKKETSALLIERTAPTSVAVNAPFTYEIKVSNLTDVPLTEVVLTDTTDANFKLASADPAPTSSTGNKHVWNIGTLAAKESKTIKITGSASKVATLRDCLEATYNTKLCNDVLVVEPKLTMSAVAPAQVLACDPIPVTYTVTNTGTGVAKNVKLNVPLENATNEQGEKTLTVNVGDLGAGESKTVNANLKAVNSGLATSKATASGDGSLKVEGATSTKVVKPELTITKKGIENVLLGREVPYTITVTNKGDGEARNVVIEDTLPTNAAFKSASDNGVLSQAKDKVTWSVGTLAPGASKEVTVAVLPAKISKLDSSAVARCYCAPAVSAVAATDVKGIPAILLEVIDQNDPVMVGDSVAYSIEATNQGSAVGTNIKIVATLEDNMEFVKADGATTATVKGNVITFEALKSLPAKEKATWRVVVKAKSAGDVRFKLNMTSDQISRPVEETESTNFYK